MILNDPAVSITCATSGLGVATTRRFAKAGAKVACLNLSLDTAQGTPPDAVHRIAIGTAARSLTVDMFELAPRGKRPGTNSVTKVAPCGLTQSTVENLMLHGTVIRLDAAARMPIK